MEKWIKKGQRYAYQGWRSMMVKTFTLPDGDTRDYDVVENAPYVVVVAFTTDQELILIRQFRPGPERVLASCCEGYIDAKETPEVAAARELREETGYEAAHIEYLRTIETAYSTEKRICLLATDCHQVGRSAGDADEFIEVFTLSLDDFYDKLLDDAFAFASADAVFLALQRLGARS